MGLNTKQPNRENTMKAITTIKNTAGGLAIYNGENELIGTVSEQKTGHKYLIAICGGPAHGKIAYATDWEDLNEKSVEIAKLAA